MKSHFITRNGERETSEYNLKEAVEVLHKYRKLYPEDKIEINSFMNKYGIKQDGELNQRLIFNKKEEAEAKRNEDPKRNSVVEVREFDIWFRRYDEKDFFEFYSEIENLEEAINEALKKYSGLAFFAINYDGEKVAKYGQNLITKPE